MHRSVLLSVAAFIVVASVCLGVPALAGAATFSNPGAITIPSVGTATPYPSTIDVSGLSGTITDVNVTVNDFWHQTPSDVDVLLVGPTGEAAELFGNAGDKAVQFRTFTFDDSAASTLPCGA